MERIETKEPTIKNESKQKITPIQAKFVAQTSYSGTTEEFGPITKNYIQNPKIVCLQETFLKETSSINFKHYQLYNHFKKNKNKASGGVLILVRKDISQHQINIDSELQAIAVKATLDKLINIYIPSYAPISKTKIN